MSAKLKLYDDFLTKGYKLADIMSKQFKLTESFLDPESKIELIKLSAASVELLGEISNIVKELVYHD
jgi:hypothetical protein